MGSERRDHDRVPMPMAWEPPDSEAELRAQERMVREAANEEAAIRGAGVVGALGGNVPIGSGGLIGRGGALGLEETDREDALDERIAPGAEDRPDS